MKARILAKRRAKPMSATPLARLPTAPGAKDRRGAGFLERLASMLSDQAAQHFRDLGGACGGARRWECGWRMLATRRR
jgi:hypothetical protein